MAKEKTKALVPEVVTDAEHPPAVQGGKVARRAKHLPPASRSKVYDPMTLIALAVDRGLDAVSIEKLVAMQERAKAAQARREYYDALRLFQAELLPVVRSRVVKNKPESQDKYGEDRFRYAPIEVIVKTIGKGCDKHGFTYTFDSGDYKESKIPVWCDITHTGGHTERHTFPSPVLLEEGKKLGQSAAQVVNGAITFGRRVSLVMGFGIMFADPDPEGPQPQGDIQEPKSTDEAQPEKKADKKRPTVQDLQTAYDEVQTLVKQKAKGKAVDSFMAAASKHLQADRVDLLQAMARSLRGMKQGVAK